MTRQHITPWLPAALALLLAAGFAALGGWQLQRGQAKQALLDAHAAAAAAPAQPLAQALAADAVVARVQGCGQWLAPLLVLDNQQHEGRAGHRSYQAWRSDSGALLLVERGWRPWDGRRSPPPLHAQQGRQCLSGRLQPWPAPGLRTAGQQVQALPGGAWLLVRLQRDSLARVPGLDASALDTRLLRPAHALPGDPPPSTALLPNTLPPQRHLGYAVQWFGLALTVLVVAGITGWRHRQRTKE